MRTTREPEFCDDCGERVGYYDASLPEGEKIVITRDCECVRRDRKAVAPSNTATAQTED